MTSSDVWDAARARRYDDAMADAFTAEELSATVDMLLGLCTSGGAPVQDRAPRALELAIGAGRVAIPLAQRGVEVSGIELSQPMLDILDEKLRDAPFAIDAVQGDMATTRLASTFDLVYLVFNTIGNLRTQDEQVACFANAAAHLRPGGHFVVEVGVPPLRSLPPGADVVPFDVSEEHVGLDSLDVVTQEATSHHYTRQPDGSYRYQPHHYRYVWPSELDLMARLAGLTLTSRHADWAGAPFTSESASHVSVWTKGSSPRVIG